MTGALHLLTQLALLVCTDPAACSAAYCRTRVDTGVVNDPNAHCLYWPVTTFPYDINQNGDPALGSAAFSAIEAAFNSWQAVSNACGNLTYTEGPRSTSRTIGYDASGSNENLILFRTKNCSFVAQTDPCWSAQPATCNNQYDCWEEQSGTIALTTTTYEPDTGWLKDADIELNAATYNFTWASSAAGTSTDLQYTVTHEAGHAIGLGHNLNTSSIMYCDIPTPQQQIAYRTIDPGTQQFMCDVYPKGHPSRDCIIDPVNDTLGGTPGCGCGAGPAGGVWAAGVLLLAASRRGRRRRA